MIQTLLFISGLSTFFQTLFGTRLPSVAVGSYAYVIPITSIVLANRHTSIVDPHEVNFCNCSLLLIQLIVCLTLSLWVIFQRFVETMRAIQGALIISGCFQMVMGFLGLWRNAVR